MAFLSLILSLKKTPLSPSLLINMKTPQLHPALFLLKILRDTCLGFIQLAAYFPQLRFDPIFLETCESKISFFPHMSNTDNIVPLIIPI